MDPRFPDGSTPSPVALLFNNVWQFHQIENLVKTSPVPWDFIAPDPYNEMYEVMINDAREYLAARNLKLWNINDVPEGHIYRAVLTPYIIEGPHPPSHYKVRYLYGLAKEDYNFDIFNLNYDLVLCFGPYDEEFISGYTKTVQTGNVRYAFTPPRPQREAKPPYKLLYLPTWRENCSVPYMVKVLEQLKESFDVSIRLHMASHYREPHVVEMVQGLGKILDIRQPLQEQLLEADVVLSDGSGAIFDTIAMDVPIVVFQPVPPEPFEGKPSLEQMILQAGMIPWAEDAADVPDLLLEAASQDPHGEARRQLAAELFPLRGEQGLEAAWNALLPLIQEEPMLSGDRLARQRAWRQLTSRNKQIRSLRNLIQSVTYDLAAVRYDGVDPEARAQIESTIQQVLLKLAGSMGG